MSAGFSAADDATADWTNFDRREVCRAEFNPATCLPQAILSCIHLQLLFEVVSQALGDFRAVRFAVLSGQLEYLG